ncbi:Gfo/Idh/MocA family oxidoreductase [Chloroflexota bacterium]
MKESLKTAVVGCGEVTSWHISSMLGIDNVDLVAICDLNENLARQVAEKHKIKRYYADFSEMLSKEKLDVVDICTPPQTHFSLVLQSVEAGHHVLVEKPMALNLNEAEKMISAAKERGVKLCVAHSEMFLPIVMKAKSIVERGIVGDVVGMHITDTISNSLVLNREHWAHRLPGGIFGEMLPHSIYVATAFMGRLELAGVYVCKASPYDWMKADELRVVLKGKQGLAVITESANCSKDIMVVDILGTRKLLHVDHRGSVMTVFGVDGKQSAISRGWIRLTQIYQLLAYTACSTLITLLGRFRSGHYTLIKRFMESIQNGTEPPVSVEEIRETVRLWHEITARI